MIRQMVAHLARRGRRTIFCLNPPQGNIIFNRENFKQALAATGLACDESHILTSTHSSDLLAGLHHDRRMPDAFFCFDDMSAINTMKDLQHLGYRIPEQVAVVGYNNIEVSRYVTPELTTIDNHIDQMTGLAAKLLIEKIEGSGYQDLEVEIEGELVIRASCGSNVKAAR
jgi:DNA-binding LacI/PurR family transcriptional regulator